MRLRLLRSPASSGCARLANAARIAALVGLGAAVLGVAACAAPRYEDGWSRLRRGMSRTDVERLLGSPSSTYLPPAPADAASETVRRPPASRGERWQYGDTLSSMATRAMFPDEADERAWCVFFGPDGAVTGFRPPSWASGFAAEDPDAVSR